VNKVGNNGAELIEPIDDQADPPLDLSLVLA
jgi:hypothetical protein